MGESGSRAHRFADQPTSIKRNSECPPRRATIEEEAMTKRTSHRQTLCVLIAFTLFGAVGAARRNPASPLPDGFAFAPVAYLGDPAPGGGTFLDVFESSLINNRGEPTDSGVHLADEPYLGLGAAVYSADTQGHISTIVGPGDPAPGGGVFDWAVFPQTNALGDVAFMGHLAGEECRPAGFPPHAFLMACLASVYVKDAATGQVRSIAHAGHPAPGGGVYRQAISPMLNNHGDVVFLGDLTPPPEARRRTGGYRHSNGVTLAVARRGNPMPGGGHFVTASNVIGWQISVNNPGDVAFNAVLDTDDNGDGVPDTGLFVWSHGVLRLVARSGTQIPDIGEVAHLVLFPTPARR
jgi:hypothetical protein